MAKALASAPAALALEDGGGVEIGVGQETAPRGMRRIGRADEKGGDRRAMGGIGGRVARLRKER